MKKLLQFLLCCAIAIVVVHAPVLRAQDNLKFVQFNDMQIPKDSLRNCRVITWTRKVGISLVKSSDVFCDDAAGRLIRVGNPRTMMRDYLKLMQYASPYEDIDALIPAFWVNKLPTETLGHWTLFQLYNIKLGKFIAFTNPTGPYKNEASNVSLLKFGHVIHSTAPSAEYYTFPVCLQDQCIDPDVNALGVGMVKVSSEFPNKPFIYLALPTKIGMRYCLLLGEKHNLFGEEGQDPECYNESNTARTFDKNNLAAEGMLIDARWSALKKGYEERNNIKPGDIILFGMRIVCDKEDIFVVKGGNGEILSSRTAPHCDIIGEFDPKN